MASASAGPKAGVTRLQGGDLGLAQLALEQHPPEFCLQPRALQRLAVGGARRQARLSA